MDSFQKNSNRVDSHRRSVSKVLFEKKEDVSAVGLQDLNTKLKQVIKKQTNGLPTSAYKQYERRYVHKREESKTSNLHPYADAYFKEANQNKKSSQYQIYKQENKKIAKKSQFEILARNKFEDGAQRNLAITFNQGSQILSGYAGLQNSSVNSPSVGIARTPNALIDL